MDILCRERHTTTARLAAEVGVTERTIRNDITTLSLHYPIQTIRGRYGGGVQLADWFKPPVQHAVIKAEEPPGTYQVFPCRRGFDRAELDPHTVRFAGKAPVVLPMHLENRISKDIDTFLTGPLDERGKRRRRMRQDHLWKRGYIRSGQVSPEDSIKAAKNKVPSGSHPSKSSPWQAVLR